ALERVQLDHLDWLRYGQRLEKVYISHSKIKDFSALARMPRLSDLEITESSLQNADFLGSLKWLRYLNLARNDLADIARLSRLVHLEKLILAGNKRLTALHGIESFAELRTLDVSGTGIHSLSPIASLSELTALFLENTPIKEISALK